MTAALTAGGIELVVGSSECFVNRRSSATVQIKALNTSIAHTSVTRSDSLHNVVVSPWLDAYRFSGFVQLVAFVSALK